MEMVNLLNLFCFVFLSENFEQRSREGKNIINNSAYISVHFLAEDSFFLYKLTSVMSATILQLKLSVTCARNTKKKHQLVLY